MWKIVQNFRYFIIKKFKKLPNQKSPKGKKAPNLVTLSVVVSRCATPLPACFQLKFFAGNCPLLDF
jgi:hypothetical protein